MIDNEMRKAVTGRVDVKHRAPDGLLYGNRALDLPYCWMKRSEKAQRQCVDVLGGGKAMNVKALQKSEGTAEGFHAKQTQVRGEKV